MYITVLDFKDARVYRYKLTAELYEMCTEKLFKMLDHDFDNCHFMFHIYDETVFVENVDGKIEYTNGRLFT